MEQFGAELEYNESLVFDAELDLVRASVGGRLADRDVIRIFGSDARTFLQGQLTQDITDLEPNQSRWSLILSPKGRVEALVRVWGGHSESEMLLDVAPGFGHLVVDRLNRFRLRVKASVELLSWEILHLLGPGGPEVAALTTAQMREFRPWSASVGLVLLGPTITVPDDLHLVSPELLEAFRVRDCWPSMANEITALNPAPMPAELGPRIYGLSISHTKGCYTGQELVARVHSRGASAPRTLVCLEFEDETVPPIGASVSAGDASGAVTSSAPSIDNGRGVALAFVGRGIGPSDSVQVAWSDGQGQHVLAGRVLEGPSRSDP